MNHYEAAKKVYEREACSRTFVLDLELHLRHGFVFSRPDFFIMGRAVIRDADPALIVDPEHSFEADRCDCWHIYLFAGAMGPAFSIMPWVLPWVSMERKNELRFLALSSIQRFVKHWEAKN